MFEEWLKYHIYKNTKRRNQQKKTNINGIKNTRPRSNSTRTKQLDNHNIPLIKNKRKTTKKSEDNDNDDDNEDNENNTRRSRRSKRSTLTQEERDLDLALYLSLKQK
eukprot:TRINITY_DN1606_c0_g1_i2.p1 TRINITY_DN1606_c0_g1~~TRINITY_DN1606_c0_g1_i2.p1  ORF type:complete len:107 (-),score=31.10 TRINITY_DN1606_c0_g1_i2:59-379(-)